MAEGEKKMKKEIHPEYNRINAVCITCGNEFEAGSTLSAIKVDTCSNCHPFYTGKQNSVLADGRVDKFNKRFVIAEKAKVDIAKQKEEKVIRTAEREALNEEN